MKRKEHIEYCKNRALEYVKIGDFSQAFISMTSDLESFEETKNHAGIKAGIMLMMSGRLSTTEEMTEFINGFN